MHCPHRLTAIAAALVLIASACAAPSDGTAAEPSAGTAGPPSAPAVSAPTLRYVALGDSAASAPLVPDQVEPAGCLRSDNNYPSVLARELPALLTDVTCSGARTPDLLSRPQRTFAGAVAPQLDAVAADTDLVTVTIGGNDVDLSASAARCRRASLDLPACTADLLADGADTISAAIDAAAPRWAALLDAVTRHAPRARVVLVGYGNYVRPGGCFPDQPINPRDADYFQAKIDELDDRLRAVAEQRGLEFFDVRAVSAGHDMCADPGERYIEGFQPSSPAAPLHPNAAGAAALGRALADYLR